MKFIFALLLVATLQAAEPFEGSIVFRSTNPKGKTSDMTYSLKGSKSRIDMATPKRGNLSVIVDSTAKSTLLLIESKKAAISRPLKDASIAAGSKATLSKTGRTAAIAGYNCDEYTAKSEGDTARVWVTAGLGAFRHFEGGPMGNRARVPRWEKELADLGLFPLKLIDKGITYEALKVEKKSLEDSFFQAPAGYVVVEK